MTIVLSHSEQQLYIILFTFYFITTYTFFKILSSLLKKVRDSHFNKYAYYIYKFKSWDFVSLNIKGEK